MFTSSYGSSRFSAYDYVHCGVFPTRSVLFSRPGCLALIMKNWVEFGFFWSDKFISNFNVFNNIKMTLYYSVDMRKSGEKVCICGCQMRFVKIPAISSTVPDLSCVVIRKRHRENRETRSAVKLQLICPYFGWFFTFRCVRDVKITPRTASTIANKLRWRICPDHIHY